jgi:hypothetical protein
MTCSIGRIRLSQNCPLYEDEFSNATRRQAPGSGTPEVVDMSGERDL